MQDAEALLHQIQALPPDRIAEITDFVAFITVQEQRALTRGTAAASAAAFAAIWDNPEDDAYNELYFGDVALVPSRATTRYMDVALQRAWTIKQFLAWASAKDGRYEFDGIRPVAMTGGNANHSRLTMNIHVALRSRLRGSSCSNYGPDLGVQTIDSKIRYPDALITCTKLSGTDQLAPDVQIVFEVLSPSSGRTDRIEKVREYAAVPSIRRYVILETRSAGLLVLHRQQAGDAWTATALTSDDTLDLPEVGIQIPVTELYEDMDLAGTTEE